jgi:hypothetical protein
MDWHLNKQNQKTNSNPIKLKIQAKENGSEIPKWFKNVCVCTQREEGHLEKKKNYITASQQPLCL